MGIDVTDKALSSSFFSLRQLRVTSIICPLLFCIWWSQTLKYYVQNILLAVVLLFRKSLEVWNNDSACDRCSLINVHLCSGPCELFAFWKLICNPLYKISDRPGRILNILISLFGIFQIYFGPFCHGHERAKSTEQGE